MRTPSFRRTLPGAALALCSIQLMLAGISHAAPASSYSVTLLDPDTEAVAVNEAGVVAVNVSTAGGYSAGYWQNGQLFSLHPQGSASSRVNDINNAGVLVGSVSVGAGQQAARWDAGQVSVLASSYANTAANAINDAGFIVGHSGVRSGMYVGDNQKPLAWDSSGVAELNGVGWRGFDHPHFISGQAMGLNNQGQMVGTLMEEVRIYVEWPGSSFTEYMPGAVSWSGVGEDPVVLPPDLGVGKASYAINDAGWIAGWSDFQASLWAPGSSDPIRLDSAFYDNSGALSINNAGDAVGFYAEYGVAIAALWANGARIELNAFLDPEWAAAGWVLSEAHDINEQGWIVGRAYNPQLEAWRGFVMTPVPEPGVALLAVAGAGMVWGATRRRRASATRH